MLSGSNHLSLAQHAVHCAGQLHSCTMHFIHVLTCSQFHLSCRLASDKLLQVLDSQDEGMHICAGSHTSLPAAHGGISACVVEQQDLSDELAGATKGYDGP